MKCAASTSANGWESAAHGPGGHASCLAFSFFLLFCGNGVGSRTLTGFTCLLVHRQDRPAKQWTVGVLTRAVGCCTWPGQHVCICTYLERGELGLDT